MTTSYSPPVNRRDGDLFFNHLVGDKKFQIQVTHECLGDAFGSDGSAKSDLETFHENLPEILDVATEKARRGDPQPIQIKSTDF